MSFNLASILEIAPYYDSNAEPFTEGSLDKTKTCKIPMNLLSLTFINIYLSIGVFNPLVERVQGIDIQSRLCTKPVNNMEVPQYVQSNRTNGSFLSCSSHGHES